MKRRIRFVGVAAVLGIALIAGIGKASAISPGQNGILAFIDSPNIAIVNPDGTGLLDPFVVPDDPTAAGLHADNPDWSADGSKLAFDSGQQLWVVNADGTNLHTVASIPGWAVDPSWSPDGQSLAFESREPFGFGAGPASIKIIQADGTGLRTVIAATPNESYGEPAWSPHGNELLAERDVANTSLAHSSIVVMNLNGGSVAVLDAPEHGGQDAAPAWSPNGAQVVFARSQGSTSNVLRVDRAGNGTETDLTPQHDNFWKHPTWSPDGTLIAATDQTPTWDVWTFSASSGFAPGSPTTKQVTAVDNAEMPTWRSIGLNTPAGPGIEVHPADSNTGTTPATVRFANVLTSGSTTLTTSAAGPAVPSGFSIDLPPTYYDIHTTATFDTVVVCISGPGITSATRLVHYTGGVTPGADVTSSASLGIVCSTSLTSLSPFVLATVIDITPPTIAVSHVPDGLNGWNVHAPVPLTIDASDTGGLVGTPTCSEATPITGEGVHTVTCTATDNAGNHASATDTVMIDTQAPVVAYTGNLGTYSAGQAVSIACSASDASPGSGLATNTCANISGTFAAGPHTFSASASDVAGNSGGASVTFVVSAATTTTPQALCVTTLQDVQGSAKYRALPPVFRLAVDLVVNGICRNAATLKPAQVQAWAAAYRAGVTELVKGGWLTAAQGASLIAQSRLL